MQAGSADRYNCAHDHQQDRADYQVAFNPVVEYVNAVGHVPKHRLETPGHLSHCYEPSHCRRVFS
jgi:hypothetical protein